MIDTCVAEGWAVNARVKSAHIMPLETRLRTKKKARVRVSVTAGGRKGRRVWMAEAKVEVREVVVLKEG